MTIGWITMKLNNNNNIGACIHGTHVLETCKKTLRQLEEGESVPTSLTYKYREAAVIKYPNKIYNNSQ